MKKLIAVLILLIVLLCIGLGYFITKSNNNGKAFDDLVSAHKIFKDSVIHSHAKDGAVVATKQVAVVDPKAFTEVVNENSFLKNQLANMGIKLKKIQAVSVTETTTQENVSIKFPSVKDTNKKDSGKMAAPIPCDFKPFAVKDSTKYHLATGTVYKDSLHLKLISFDSAYTVNYVAGGFLRKEVIKQSILHTNPNVITTSVQTLKIVPDRKFYQTNTAKVGFGALLGAIAYRELQLFFNKP